MATSYNIYESTGTGAAFNYFDSVVPATAGDAPPTTYTATGLPANTTPLFYVTAVNSSGESPAPTSGGTITGTGVAIPTGVSNVTATASPDGSSATVTWNIDPAAFGYLIGRQTDGDSTITPVGTVGSG